MEKKSQQKNHPWSNLSTVTSFDKGLSKRTAKFIGDGVTQIINKESSSIMISAWIKYACLIIEEDKVRSDSLYYFLCDAMYRMNFIDSSYKLEAFKLAQGNFVNAICNLTSTARSTIDSNAALPIPRPIRVYVSLYEEQFEEIEFIAGGGFGCVYRALHKLDGVEYAIKKIFVKSEKIKTIFNYLEEVKTLAKLNHTNIVSYKQAWIESRTMPSLKVLPSSSKINSNTFESSVSQSVKSSINKIKSCNSYSERKTCRSPQECRSTQEYKSSSSSNDILNKQSVKTSESSSDIVSFREDKESCDISFQESVDKNIIQVNSKTSSEESSSSDEPCENGKICQYSSQNNQYTILYIQMALCEKTLRQWLDQRTEPTSIATITSIATQILYGLNYIHSLKIVHHDIKPSNIFISTSKNLQVQLGDFGLACPLEGESHDAIVGTCMYAAPEQLKGECNPKSDIYSLGIVFLELLIPMATSMECIKMIETLKSGEIPTKLALSHPKWVNTIRQMTEKNPANRPSAEELLENFKIDKDIIISKLQDENNKLKTENDVLQNDNKKKEQIIKEQEILIEKLKAQLTKIESEK